MTPAVPRIAPRLADVTPTRRELVPWTDKKGRLHPLRATVFALLLLPLAWLLLRWQLDMLGPERINAAIHSTGYYTIWLLVISLTVTPLKALSGLPNVVVVRRMIGNAALLYAGLHLVLYATDQHWRMLTIASEILKRFYLTIGFVALIGLVMLGLTSTDGWARWLGKTWKKLHRLVYALMVLGLVHYILQSKLDVSQALLAAGVFTWLMLWRSLPLGKDRQWPYLLLISVAAALATLAFEYLWYRFGTRINPMKVVLAEADIAFGLHPAGQVLLLGLVATAVSELRRIGTTDVGGTLLFTTAVYAMGAFVDDLAAFMMGWSYDDIIPEGADQTLSDLYWVVILGLMGLARWRLRDHPLRRVIDGVWLACVVYQFAVVGFGSRLVGAAGAAMVIAATLLVGQRLWLVSREAALMLVPLAMFLAYRITTFL